MSKHVVKCERCERYWNHKHQGDNCPECGWYRYTGTAPASLEDLQRLKEHFNAKA